MCNIEIAITGGRNRIPDELEMNSFWNILFFLSPNILRHGAARGTDTYVSEQVKSLCPWIEVIPYYAQWDMHGKTQAGKIRNIRMLTYPNKVSALIAFPGNRGTAHCIREAEKRQIPVFKISPDWVLTT